MISDSTWSSFRDIEDILNALQRDPDAKKLVPSMKSLCQKLKENVDLGKHLEIISEEKLDDLMNVFTKLCQDQKLYYLDRLQFLEIIELRSVNWRKNKILDNFYQEKRERYQAAFAGSKKRKRKEKESKKKSFRSETVLEVSGVELHIYSKSEELVEEAKSFLEDHYLHNPIMISRTDSANTNIKYSKEELLEISKSELCVFPPRNWETLKTSLPKAMMKC